MVFQIQYTHCTDYDKFVDCVENFCSASFLQNESSGPYAEVRSNGYGEDFAHAVIGLW